MVILLASTGKLTVEFNFYTSFMYLKIRHTVLIFYDTEWVMVESNSLPQAK